MELTGQKSAFFTDVFYKCMYIYEIFSKECGE